MGWRLNLTASIAATIAGWIVHLQQKPSYLAIILGILALTNLYYFRKQYLQEKSNKEMMEMIK